MSVDLNVLKKELEELEQGFSDNQLELKNKEQKFKNEELEYYKSVSTSFKLLQVLSTKQVHFLATHLNLRTKQYEALRKSVDAKKTKKLVQKLPSLPEHKVLGRKNNIKPADTVADEEDVESSTEETTNLVENINSVDSVDSKLVDNTTSLSAETSNEPTTPSESF
jgi:hypothetical protein